MKLLNFLHAIGMLGGATLVVGGTVGPKDSVRGAGGVGAGGIQGLVEPSSSPPALDLAAEKAATLFPLDGMDADARLLQTTQRTWDFEDGTMQGFELESGDCGVQPVEYRNYDINHYDNRWTNDVDGGTYYVNTHMPDGPRGGTGDLQVCAYADKTNTFQIESDTTITYQSRGHRLCLKQLSDEGPDAELVCKGFDLYQHHLASRTITSADLSSHVGKMAYLWFADERTNAWGMFQLDNVVVTNAAFETAALTTNPTSAPTSAPSSSPVIPPPGPWGIVHQGFSSDFSNSSLKDIVLEYLIGKARDYETVLLDKDCEANITGIGVTTTRVKTPLNNTYEHLLVQHDVNTSSIAESSAWNGTSNELEVCQIVRLFLPASKSGGNGKMVLAEDIRQIKIAFDVTADFNITAGLAAATVSNETATTDLSSFVRAYKCNTDDPVTEDNSALGPNDELSVCVVSEAPNEVNVEEIVTMTATQNDANLDIVQERLPFINSLTSIISIGDGVMVTTRLPSNTFTFANDQSITIQGEVEMTLANGGARKLRVLVDAGIEGDEMGSYDLEVNLQEGDGVATDGVFAMGNSAIAAVALDKVFAFAAALAFVFAA